MNATGPTTKEREAHLRRIFEAERDMARRRDHPTRKERFEDFWWAVKDESKLLAKAIWGDLIVPGVDMVLTGAFVVAVIVAIGFLLAQGLKLGGL